MLRNRVSNLQGNMKFPAFWERENHRLQIAIRGYARSQEAGMQCVQKKICDL